MSHADTTYLARMFAEMTGSSNAKSEIIAPKVVEIREIVRHICCVMQLMATNNALRQQPDLAKGLDQLAEFVQAIKNEFPASDELDDEDHYLAMTSEDLNAHYAALKENETLRTLIRLAGRLAENKVCLQDIGELRGTFIAQVAGLSYRPFSFSELDLGYAWHDGSLSATGKKYVLLTLHHVYTDTLDLYRVITSPDIDVAEFTDLLIASIDRLSTTPGLSRCKHAFHRIRSSVEMLRTNFTEYYRESVSVGMPSTIIQNFILDVSKGGAVNAQMTWEFKKIINYMQKMSVQNGRAQDPQVRQLFSILQHNFNLLG